MQVGLEVLITYLKEQAVAGISAQTEPERLVAKASRLPAAQREVLVTRLAESLEGLLAEEVVLDEGAEFIEINYAAADWEPEGEVDEEAWQTLCDWIQTISAGHIVVPPLTPDEDIQRLLARQREMMAHCFEAIGEERKAVKQAGLAFQQIQLEQQHALRLLLSYPPNSAALVDHLKRCLAEADYGYGPRGNNGRTIAQALLAVSEELGLSFEETSAAWAEEFQPFRHQVLSGIPFCITPRFDETTLDTFEPVLCRLEGNRWRLGVEGAGRFQDFQVPDNHTGAGLTGSIWDEIGDTYVTWADADNDAWLAEVKRQAGRLPDSLHRYAWGEGLRRETCTVALEEGVVTLNLDRGSNDTAWPRGLVLGDSLGITRLSGHAFYELTWVDEAAGTYRSRRFDLNNSSRRKIPVEHVELAVAIAQVAGKLAITPEPAEPDEIEAAFLRRMKVEKAVLGPPDIEFPVTGVKGQGLVSYQVGNIKATWLQGDAVLAVAWHGEQAMALKQNEQTERLEVIPVVRNRMRGRALMRVLVEEVGEGGAWMRAMLSWLCWLVWAQRDH